MHHYRRTMLPLRLRAPPITSLIRDARYCTPLRQYSSFTPTRPLAGTVPDHTAYVLLHTHAPPSEYPARSKSPLWRQLTLKARAWGGIVNFAWAPEHALHPRYTGLGEGGDGGGLGERGEEAYVASVFSASHRGRLHIPEVTLANVDVIDAEICAYVQPGVPDPNATEAHGQMVQSAPSALSRWQSLDRRLFLYVCTHGSRDCRCGDAGGEVARALRSQVAERGVGDEVCIGEVAHVGGHKWVQSSA